MRKSWHVYQKEQISKIPQSNQTHVVNVQQNKQQNIKQALERLSRSCLKEINEVWITIVNKFSPQSTEDKLLASADLWPCTIPDKLLSYFLNRRPCRIKVSDTHEQAIEDILVLWIRHQRLQRCLRYLVSKNENALLKELQNPPHQNWTPNKHRDWLVLELEGDFTIRRLQVKVARRMIRPSNSGIYNTVMQLNMGEGKTSVIIPMVASTLTNKGKSKSGDHHLVRVIVLKSLFNMNYAGLVEKLGGLLNKRVYYFPCSRDCNTFDNDKEIVIFKKLLEECKQNRGIVITVPEYCLSFKLKGIELSCNSSKSQQAAKLIEIQMWLDNTSRDILDESDELLKVCSFEINLKLKTVSF